MLGGSHLYRSTEEAREVHRLGSPVLALASACLLVLGSNAAAGEVPPAQVDFSVEGETFLGGQSVDMSGDIDPATVPEVVRLETQVFRNDAWRAYDIKRTRTNARGRFSFTHAAFPRGRRYRTRAIWAETVDHLAGKTVWDGFRVARRGHT